MQNALNNHRREHRMESIEFLVSGSAPEPYRVSFHREGGKLTAFCTCQAGLNGQACKHRLDILAGAVDGLPEGSGPDVRAVCAWLQGTALQQAVQQVQALEAEMDAVKRRLAVAKKGLAVTMRG